MPGVGDGSATCDRGESTTDAAPVDVPGVVPPPVVVPVEVFVPNMRAPLRCGSIHSNSAFALTFGAFDFLLRVEESRILLERHQNRLIESKSRNPRGGTCSATRSSAGITRPAKNAEGYKNPQDNKKFSHRRLAIRCAENSARI